MIHRRKFIASALGLIAAPAIIKVSNLDFGLLRGYNMDPLVPAWKSLRLFNGDLIFRESSAVPYLNNHGIPIRQALVWAAEKLGHEYQLMRKSEVLPPFSNNSPDDWRYKFNI